jgi:hypothetical protein
VAELGVVRAVPIIKVRAWCCLVAAAAMTSGDKFSSRTFLWVVEDRQPVAARQGCEAAAACRRGIWSGGRKLSICRTKAKNVSEQTKTLKRKGAQHSQKRSLKHFRKSENGKRNRGSAPVTASFKAFC